MTMITKIFCRTQVCLIKFNLHKEVNSKCTSGPQAKQRQKIDAQRFGIDHAGSNFQRHEITI